MAATSTISHNEVDTNVKNMSPIVYHNPHFQGQWMQWWHQKCHWMRMVYKIAI